jgi:predicted nucleotidyltransferase
MDTKLTVNQIIKILQEELPFLRKRYGVKSLSLFGSYVRDEQTPVSDLDLLVTFHETPGFFKYINLENHLSDTLGIKVDLVMEDALKSNIGKRIKKEAISL